MEKQQIIENVFKPFQLGSKVKTSDHPPVDLIKASNVFKAYKVIKSHIRRTPIQYVPKVSERMGAKVYFKREDGQPTGSYKVRGIFYRLLNLTEEQKQKGVICATTGNQGASLGYACQKLNIKAVIVMPDTVPSDKVNHMKRYACSKNTSFIQHGLRLSDSVKFAEQYSKEHDLTIINFEDEHVVEGCATVAVDVLEDIPENKIDYILYSMSSGSLATGLGSYIKQLSPETQQIGVEPDKEGYEQLSVQKINQNEMTTNLFDESTALRDHRDKHSKILSQTLDAIYHVDDGMACAFVTFLFNQEKIIVEPYSAVCPAALDYIKEQIKGKVVVCILCGSFRYDIAKLAEIRTLSNVHEGKLHYLLVNFFAKNGAIKQFLLNCLGDQDYVCQIEYTRKNNREKGPALVGIESPNAETFGQILEKLKQRKIDYKILKPSDELFRLKV